MANNKFKDIQVKIGDKVEVTSMINLPYDKYYMLLNQQMFKFPGSKPIDITDYLVEGKNTIKCVVDNISGGPFGEPSKWAGSFYVSINGTMDILTWKTDSGDDWYDKKEHVVLEGNLVAKF